MALAKTAGSGLNQITLKISLKLALRACVDLKNVGSNRPCGLDLFSDVSCHFHIRFYIGVNAYCWLPCVALLVKTAPPRKSLHGAAALHGHMGGFRKVFARFSRGFREAFARLSLPKYFRERFRRAEKPKNNQFLRAAGAPAPRRRRTGAPAARKNW